ncbi:Transcription initiation factor IIF subunit alpha [Ananas comosus]|uniref:Transcription initiation factor IIF subunit alpha n=1 Tax=Ananas comosus TaxID=4615 RepID=A0A199UEV0_ANACO|nr:Transcription initiation factor IIF subunit alpha [Ananas comosus]
MSMDLVLKPACEGCGSTSDLYGTNCKHTTLCLSCGKAKAQNRARCLICGAPITNLIREYNVRANATMDKSFSIGRFVTGLPPFSKKKSAENKWSLHKEGLQGRQLTDTLREKYKNKPWILEDETGQYQYQGQLEGSQSSTATYYLLMLHGKEFLAFPAGSWYNFSKIAQYKQLTLEEAEEKMNKRKNNATGYERWMMKAATNGAAAFGETKKNESTGSERLDVGRPKKGKNNEDEDHSDKGEENEEEEVARKNKLELNKKGVDDDDDEGGKGDFDLDDDEIEKGDDWEHEEIFTDDDEAVGNDPEEREDLAPEIPAPPEIKQDDDDEDEEEEGGLSKSGKELKKLLGKAAGLNESDAEEDNEEDVNYEEDEEETSPVLVPKHKEAPKDEPVENSPSKPTPPSGSARSTPSASKSSKSKRKTGSDDAKSANGATAKKVKTESETKAKDETPSSSKSSAASQKAPASAAARSGTTPSTAPVTEEEIRSVLLSITPVTTQDLVARFKARLKSKEDKAAFADILRRISKIQKTNGHSYVILKDSK